MYFVKSFQESICLSKSACNVILNCASESINKFGIFAMAISGGNSPLSTYRMLCQPQISSKINWDKTHIFWSDERCVPFDNPLNNYYCAYKNFISSVPIPQKNIHRVNTATIDPEKTALDYETELRNFFKYKTCLSEPSLFDLALLGIGSDGHTASIFADTVSAGENHRWVIPSTAPQEIEPRHRVTFTFALLNRSQTGLFIVCGKDKENVIRRIIYDRENSCYPASKVKVIGRQIYFMDFELIEP